MIFIKLFLVIIFLAVLQCHQQPLDTTPVAVTPMESTTGGSDAKPIRKAVDKLKKTKEVIKCQCNLPFCVTPDRVCEAKIVKVNGTIKGGCFSEISDDIRTTTRYGCLDMIKNEYQKNHIQCDNTPRNHNKNESSDLLLLCCQTNMCNFDPSDYDNSENESGFLPKFFPGFPYVDLNYVAKPTQSTSAQTVNSSNETWFKVVTIAVPVVGALILLLLVTVAIRLLKAEGDNDDDKNRPLKYVVTVASGGVQPVNSNRITSYTNRNLDSTALMSRNIDYGHNLIKNPQAPLLSRTAFLREHLQEVRGEQQRLPRATTVSLALPSGRPSLFSAKNSLFTTATIDCDKKNEIQAKRNHLINLEYSLLPQSSNDPNVKLTNTEEGVVNNLYNKNVNKVESATPQSFTSHTPSYGYGNTELAAIHSQYFASDNKTNKIYEKEVLNPVVIANWNL